MKYKKYKKDYEYSYAFGTFTVLNLIENAFFDVVAVYTHEKLSQNSLNIIRQVCKNKNIRLFENENSQVERIRNKDKELVFAVFKKNHKDLAFNENHIVLDKISDMGNLGNIMRTSLGFNFKNIALIGECADQFNPKTIKASMGAFFDVKIEAFDHFENYSKKYGKDREFFCFMLNGKYELKNLHLKENEKISLIFGNESSGLDDKYKTIGTSVYIKHNTKIDSLNLATAVSIAMYNFSD